MVGYAEYGRVMVVAFFSFFYARFIVCSIYSYNGFCVECSATYSVTLWSGIYRLWGSVYLRRIYIFSSEVDVVSTWHAFCRVGITVVMMCSRLL